MAADTTVTVDPRTGRTHSRVGTFVHTGRGRMAVASLAGIVLQLLLWLGGLDQPWRDVPLYGVVVAGGVPLVWDVTRALLRREAGADLLAALSIVVAAALNEWLVAAIVVLMLSGGEGLEEAATQRASSVLDALARRAPQVAHRRTDAGLVDVPAAEIEVRDQVVVLPHELCPVDGEVVEGHGTMDESYLTGEPYVIEKTPGSAAMSGAINGEYALTVQAVRRAADSRYAQIVSVLHEAEADRPAIRRLADRIGGWYTLVSLALALGAWAVSGEVDRFLAVLVIATPCPLLIAVPVAIIGAISQAARHGIIVKDVAMLEEVGRVQTVMFDKTGTLTYGRPVLTEVVAAVGVDADEVLLLAGAAEHYSRHPLASAIVEAAERAMPLGERPHDVDRVAERPGQGLQAVVAGRTVLVTSRSRLAVVRPELLDVLPPVSAGLECLVLLDGSYAATFRFRDEPRRGAASFVAHLPHSHGVAKTMVVSGDREPEVRYLADAVGVDEVHAECSPEEKLAIVRAETARARTLFIGDGVNDAPAMTAATVGVAFGQNSDITAAAASAVVLDSSLERLDELLHIGRRMRSIALQSAVGGMVLSFGGMVLAAVGLLPPLLGALAQEGIDLLAILNAARVAARREPLRDFREPAIAAPGQGPGAVE